MEVVTTHLEPLPPFDFSLTAGHRTRFSADLGTEIFKDGIYRRVSSLRGRPLLLSFSSFGTVERPRLRLEATGENVSANDVSALEEQATWLLGLDYDLTKFYSVIRDDPILAGLTKRLYGLKPTRELDIFETLITTILGQQISGRVARVMRRELVQAYGEPFHNQGAIYYRFPTPETLASLDVGDLQRHKLSQRKAQYLRDISRAVAEGELDLDGLRDLSDEGALRKLTGYRGIGAWTAQWVLCLALGRFHVFPAGDLAILRTLSRLYLDGRAVTPAEADAFAERWGDYRVPVITYVYAALRQGMKIVEC